MSQQPLTIQQYAIKHKLSTFATIKLITQGKLKTLKQTIDGVEHEFIIDENIPTTAKKEPTATDDANSKKDYEQAYHQLLAKYSALQEKYTALLEKHNA